MAKCTRASPQRQSAEVEEADKEAEKDDRARGNKKHRILTEPNFRKNDVLFGRGSSYNSHNKETAWRSFVDHPYFKAKYQHHSYKDRYAQQVIGLVRANSRPLTRFLIQTDANLKSWTEADEDDVIEKTKRKLREKNEPSQNMTPVPMPEITMMYHPMSLLGEDVHHAPLLRLPSTDGVAVTPCGTFMLSESLATARQRMPPSMHPILLEEQSTKETAEGEDEPHIAAESLSNLSQLDKPTTINDSSKEQAHKSGEGSSKPLHRNRQESYFSFSSAMLEAHVGGSEAELVGEELVLGGGNEQVWINSKTTGTIWDKENELEGSQAFASNRATALTASFNYDAIVAAAVGACHTTAPAIMMHHHPPFYPTYVPHVQPCPAPHISFKLGQTGGNSESSNHRTICASTTINPSLDTFLDLATLTLNSDFAGVEALVDILAQDVQPRGLLVELVKRQLRDIKNHTDFIISRIRSESTINDAEVENEIRASAFAGV